MKKEKIRDYLRFHYKERIAFVIVIIIVAIIFVYPYVFNNREEQPLTIIKSAANENPKEGRQEYPVDDSYKSNSYSNFQPKETRGQLRETPGGRKVGRLFYFDPNTASVEDWQNLGLRDRTIKTIKNYLSKGGSFKQKEDLKKIYGLHDDEYVRLESYVKIASKEKTNTFSNNNYTLQNSNQSYQKTFNKTEKLVINDINTANANAFIALPGIGNSFANRIINFREKLGGFYSVDQIKETYGLPDSTFQLIKPMLKLNSGVRKLNINTASKEELKLHPYIRWNIANAIVEYRNQHGAFKSLDDLKNIILVDEATFNKFIPYLSLN